MAKAGTTHRGGDERIRDPEGSNRTALIAEIPDMEAFQDIMKSDAAADAVKHDGVNAETLLVLGEA
jgi:hypothetical protein